MKKSLRYAALCSLLLLGNDSSASDGAFVDTPQEDPGYVQHPKSSRSFLFTRPGQQNLCLRQALWHTLLYDQNQQSAIVAAVFGQKSGNADKIAQYFLPPRKEILYVSETALNRDVLPSWLQLPENFSGYLTMAPKQHQEGFIIEGRYNLAELSNSPELGGFEMFKYWALYGSIAFSSVENNLNLTQSDVSNPNPQAGPVNDILSAFNNPEWLFDKIDGSTKRTNFSEIRLGIATTLLSSLRALAVTYTALSFPTGKKPSNVYLFDAQNTYGHIGVISGLCMQAPLTREDENYVLAVTINLENIYLIRNHEWRTVDLYRKPWSRFMLMRKKDDPTNTVYPGVNVLTQWVSVRPHNIVDFSSGLRLSTGMFEGEVGFALWAHGGERCHLPMGAFPEIWGIAGSTVNTSANLSTIAYQAPDDPAFITIPQSDLNFSSCEQPPNLVYKAYGALLIKKLSASYDIDAGVGGYKEFPNNGESALATWGLWLSAGIAF